MAGLRKGLRVRLRVSRRVATHVEASTDYTRAMTEARIRASIDAYVSAWNEHDPAQRLRLIEQGCAADLLMRTSGRRIDGRAQLDALIADFQARQPHARAVFASAVDVQGNIFRYAGIVEGPTTAAGATALDAGECDDEGRIRILLTFVGAALPGDH